MESEFHFKGPWVEPTDPGFGFQVAVATSESMEIMLEEEKQTKD